MNPKITLIAIAVLSVVVLGTAGAACYLSGVASMPGPTQGPFLREMYITQCILVGAIVVAYPLGRFVWHLPKIGIRLVSVPFIVADVVVALNACHISDVASMPSVNQSWFLHGVYITQLGLLGAAVVLYFLGTFHFHRKPTKPTLGNK